MFVFFVGGGESGEIPKHRIQCACSRTHVHFFWSWCPFSPRFKFEGASFRKTTMSGVFEGTVFFSFGLYGTPKTSRAFFFGGFGFDATGPRFSQVPVALYQCSETGLRVIAAQALRVAACRAGHGLAHAPKPRPRGAFFFGLVR